METQCFRDILNEKYELRRSLNPSYSYSAFARDIGLTSARLSEILSFKQGLSPEKAREITDHLRMAKEESDYFVALVTSLHARSKLKREKAREKLQSFNKHYNTLQRDLFKIVSEWYHFAILEKSRVKNFVFDTADLSNQLMIDEFEVAKAIERLIKVGLLEEKSGTYKPSSEFNLLSYGIPCEFLRKYHKEIMKRAWTAIDINPLEEREYSTSQFLFDKTRMDEAKRDLVKFRREFMKKYEVPEGKEGALYSFSSQFFQLDRSI